MNFSIFSSENIKKYVSQPESVKGRHVWIVILFVFLVYSGYWLGNQFQELEYRYGPAAHLVAAREALSEETQVIFLGSSHVVSGIRPDLFSAIAMNIAGAGYNYWMLEKILRKHMDSMTNLQLAVIELDPVPLMIDRRGIRQGDHRAFFAWGLNRTDIEPESKPIGERVLNLMSDMLVPKYRFTPKSAWDFFRFWFSSSPKERIVIAGHKSWDRAIQANNQGPSRRLFRWYERFNEASLKRNRRALRCMIDLLVEHEVQIVFVQLPHHARYSNYIPYFWRQALKETEIEMETTFKLNINFWDYEQNTAFDVSHFADNAHLNSVGAKELSTLLNQRISAFIELSSQTQHKF